MAIRVMAVLISISRWGYLFSPIILESVKGMERVDRVINRLAAGVIMV